MPLHRLLICFMLTALSSLTVQADSSQPPQLAQDPAGYALAASCLGCHAEQAKDCVSRNRGAQDDESRHEEQDVGTN